MAYSYRVAEEICEDFEDLVDTEFHFDGRLLMAERVLVAPFDNVLCEQFFQQCIDGVDVATLLGQYSGEEFDVIIILSDVEDANSFSYVRIGAYVAGKGVQYNFPE